MQNQLQLEIAALKDILMECDFLEGKTVKIEQYTFSTNIGE